MIVSMMAKRLQYHPRESQWMKKIAGIEICNFKFLTSINRFWKKISVQKDAFVKRHSPEITVPF
jgi:hypothetical protein